MLFPLATPHLALVSFVIHTILICLEYSKEVGYISGLSVLLAMARKFYPAPTLLPASHTHQEYPRPYYDFSVVNDLNP